MTPAIFALCPSTGTVYRLLSHATPDSRLSSHSENCLEDGTGAPVIPPEDLSRNLGIRLCFVMKQTGSQAQVQPLTCFDLG